MKAYLIYNLDSSETLGCYEGEGEGDAMATMTRDIDCSKFVGEDIQAWLPTSGDFYSGAKLRYLGKDDTGRRMWGWEQAD